MKLKLLLFLWLLAGMVHAQLVNCEYPEEVITSLIITEARMHEPKDIYFKRTAGRESAEGYIEITNVGSDPVQLSDFKFGTLSPWGGTVGVWDLCNDPWTDTSDPYMFLPGKLLMPGESYVITNAYDYGPKHYKKYKGREGGYEMRKQIQIYDVADKLLHMEETIDGIKYPEDSVTTPFNDPEQLRPRGNNLSYYYIFYMVEGGTFYLEHHYAEGDSAVVDQLGGIFDNTATGKNYQGVYYDIAGVSNGMGKSVMLRKSSVKNGNINFASGRGVSITDSEWLPMEFPIGYDTWRDLWWTVGNHGSFVLDANTLEPTREDIIVDYANKKITVPWGIQRLDDIMRNMKKKPGIAWEYILNPLKEDSLYRSARNGDKLKVCVFGETLYTQTFDIEVKEPTADDNMVVPVDQPILRVPGATGMITERMQSGMLSWPRVTNYNSGVDTITGAGYGLAFDLRTDSLLKYLEKPSNATWEFVWVDGVARPDLKDGDKLKVTSQSGKVKEYYIQVQTYNPNQNAGLSSITWPDIPEFYRGLFGWKGDTIPNFSQGTNNYKLEIPADVEGIPALMAKTVHVNASVKVTRAKSLTGSLQDRTVTFEVTAEDDTIQNIYTVEMVREKTPDKIEPFRAEPFMSEFFVGYPTNNVFLEIYNPGNQPLDLRDYMISLGYVEGPYEAITYSTTTQWIRRYTHYIPGLKYVDEVTWNAGQVRMLLPDPGVNPIIPGNGTFVLANIPQLYTALEFYQGIFDVQFANESAPGMPNPWGERTAAHHYSGGIPMPPNGNRGNCIFLYKILNDSIKRGLKPNTDPNDFQILDIWGMPQKQLWVIGDYTPAVNATNMVFQRKPWVNRGNPEFGGAFAPGDPEKCEWHNVKPNTLYAHIPTPARYVAAWGSLHQHFMIEPTYYKSTVSSSAYKVSDGYGPNQNIKGLKTGTTVSEFLGFINKEDEGQVLKVVSVANGSELGMDAVISMNDKLEVVSADQQNQSIYRLDVTPAGLSNDAYLSSTRWEVKVTADPKSVGDASAENDGVGSVSGFDYGTTLKTVVDNVTVPAGAMLTVVDGNGAYVPFTTLNFDTMYVSVTVNPDTYFDVVAEDGVTRIVYQLQPNTSAEDAFILSDVYTVSQLDNLIHFVPRGTNFDAFMSSIIPSLGASVKLVDKMGFERTRGGIREDDKVVVTSANGENTRVYFIDFLPTAIILQNTYLAYVLSEAYLVDQVGYVISAGLAPLTSETLLDEFLSYLMPSMGATTSVVDKNGQAKSAGDLNDGDKLVVTSADGKIITTYSLALDLTSAGAPGIGKQIEIYPNPASDRLNIRGVDAGNRIQIYSASGVLIHEVKAQSRLETISMEQVPSGMFVIVVSDDQRMLGRFKAIRK